MGITKRYAHEKFKEENEKALEQGEQEQKKDGKANEKEQDKKNKRLSNPIMDQRQKGYTETSIENEDLDNSSIKSDGPME